MLNDEEEAETNDFNWHIWLSAHLKTDLTLVDEIEKKNVQVHLFPTGLSYTLEWNVSLRRCGILGCGILALDVAQCGVGRKNCCMLLNITTRV